MSSIFRRKSSMIRSKLSFGPGFACCPATSELGPAAFRLQLPKSAVRATQSEDQTRQYRAVFMSVEYMLRTGRVRVATCGVTQPSWSADHYKLNGFPPS